MKFGYACINMTLRNQNPPIYVNRNAIKKTFESKGLNHISNLILKNIKDLEKIILWNYNNNILFYRMSSEMFPWMSEYNFEDLPDIKEIKDILKNIGLFVKEKNIRLTFHPGQFNVLTSGNENIVKNSIIDLTKHAEIMDFLDLSYTTYNKINIHIGGVYGNKKEALIRWINNFNNLPYKVKSRLTIENDDKIGGYSIRDCLYINEKCNIPVVLDYHHHSIHNDNLSLEDAFKESYKTWKKIKPVIHISNKKNDQKIRAHNDFILNKINTFNSDVDVMFEAKMKEKSIFDYNIRYQHQDL